jgi:large subunit ribosomal protein L30
MNKLRIKQRRSLIGKPKKQRRTIKALGLGKVGSEAIKENCPEIVGMIKKVEHLVEVEVVK